MELIGAKKQGRNFNGAHRDQGTIIHLINRRPLEVGGENFTKALCGATPGIRGGGWYEQELFVATCEKCIEKSKQIEP